MVVILNGAAFQFDGGHPERSRLSGEAKDLRLNCTRAPAYFPAAFACAAARSRSFAIVAAAGSFRFLLFCRRFVLVT